MVLPFGSVDPDDAPDVPPPDPVLARATEQAAKVDTKKKAAAPHRDLSWIISQYRWHNVAPKNTISLASLLTQERMLRSPTFIHRF
jgi:hypothetical protein